MTWGLEGSPDRQQDQHKSHAVYTCPGPRGPLPPAGPSPPVSPTRGLQTRSLSSERLTACPPQSTRRARDRLQIQVCRLLVLSAATTATGSSQRKPRKTLRRPLHDGQGWGLRDPKAGEKEPLRLPLGGASRSRVTPISLGAFPTPFVPPRLQFMSRLCRDRAPLS